jgi:hypothetical protein
VYSIALGLSLVGYIFGALCLANRSEIAGAAWMISTAVFAGAIVIRRGLPSKDD